MKLIKFSTYNQYLLEGLTNQTLFFNNIYNFNDPFEGVFRYSISSDYNKFRKFYLNHYSGRVDKLEFYYENKLEFEKLINKTFDWRYENNGVCCFSDESNLTDILMWANYANDHKGLCLMFDSERIEFQPKEKVVNGTIILNPTGPHKIEYTDKYLDIDPFEKKLTQQTFLTTKFDKWINEKEFRFISSKPGNYTFNIDSLQKIVFGLRASKDAIETVRTIFSNIADIGYQQIVLSKNKFGFKLKEL